MRLRARHSNHPFRVAPKLEKIGPSTTRLYEEFYCARGEMENALKQQVLDLESSAALSRT